MIKAVVFDVGGVLLTLGEVPYRQEMARCLGLPSLKDYEPEVPDLQTGRKREEEVWLRLAGRPVCSSEFDAAWEANFQPIQGILNLARAIRELGLRTAVLSNTQASHVRIMRRMSFLPGFDPVAFSCEIGFRKPEMGAYKWIVDALGLKPEQVAFIDDVPEYVNAAREYGIQAIQHTGDLNETYAQIDALLDGRLRPYLAKIV